MILRRKQKGFTLIELLVVIAIIGILATIVLVSLNTARQKARDSRRQSDIRQLSLALEMYYDSANPVAYPADQASLITTYFAALPTDPSTTATYSYSLVSGGGDYCVIATMETSGAGYFYADKDGTHQASAKPSKCP